MGSSKIVAEKIRKRRRELGYSQDVVASMVGVSRQCISLWENNKKKFESGAIKASNLVALEKALHFKAGELFKAYYA